MGEDEFEREVNSSYPMPAGRGQRNRLKLVLVGGDAAAVISGYLLVLFGGQYMEREGVVRASLLVAASLVAGLWAIRSQGLLLARVSAVRVVEITRAARAMALLGGLMLLLDRIVQLGIYVHEVALATSISLVVLVISRSVYRSWLAAKRLNGAYRRKIIVIGADDEARRLIELFDTHRDIGLEVLGLIGSKELALRRGLSSMWLGELDQAETLVDAMGASGVVVSSLGVPAARLNSLVRNLQNMGVHIHLATGISGIASRRLRSMSLSHEPMLYVEAASLGRVQTVAKRTFDLVMSTIALILASPLFVVIALGVKFGDRGPVFFRQERVGRGGRRFNVLKFRTMAVDAEKRLEQLASTNERHGPLFKMTNDPRVTRIGRFLRQSSLDELPQLLNVIRGDMSLVGPRPALPSEVEQFSPALRAREQVMPGITGLWQAEARDNPSFEAYRRLDLFYVENWSITLDLLILMATLEQLCTRLLSVFRRGSSDNAAEAVEPTAAMDAKPAALASGTATQSITNTASDVEVAAEVVMLPAS